MLDFFEFGQNKEYQSIPEKYVGTRRLYRYLYRKEDAKQAQVKQHQQQVLDAFGDSFIPSSRVVSSKLLIEADFLYRSLHTSLKSHLLQSFYRQMLLEESEERGRLAKAAAEKTVAKKWVASKQALIVILKQADEKRSATEAAKEAEAIRKAGEKAIVEKLQSRQ